MFCTELEFVRMKEEEQIEETKMFPESVLLCYIEEMF